MVFSAATARPFSPDSENRSRGGGRRVTPGCETRWLALVRIRMRRGQVLARLPCSSDLRQKEQRFSWCMVTNCAVFATLLCAPYTSRRQRRRISAVYANNLPIIHAIHPGGGHVRA